MAATKLLTGMAVIAPRACNWVNASYAATMAPVIEAVRVPPSAWMTSQSRCRVRSPNACKSKAARSERPIRRWISCVRPDCLPRAASRSMRVCVERGSMPYSAVIQPWPLPFRKPGTLSSMLAVQMTLVSPHSISTEPSACLVYWRVMRMARSASTARPLGRDSNVMGMSCVIGVAAAILPPRARPFAVMQQRRAQWRAAHT